jgi:outer membrane protein
MPIPRHRSRRPSAVALAVSLAALAPALASAQSLIQLYDAAHAYDASYLAARAQYESAPYRVDQTRALLRPTLSLGATPARSRPTSTTTRIPSNSSYGVTVTGRQPILNKSSRTTIAQSERSLVSSLADLDAAEQDLMLRVSQAYFDVLGAQDTLTTTRANKARSRAARLGQAQLRGRHRDDHRHARGAGALRPGDGAGDRRRERPA